MSKFIINFKMEGKDSAGLGFSYSDPIVLTETRGPNTPVCYRQKTIEEFKLKRPLNSARPRTTLPAPAPPATPATATTDTSSPFFGRIQYVMPNASPLTPGNDFPDSEAPDHGDWDLPVVNEVGEEPWFMTVFDPVP